MIHHESFTARHGDEENGVGSFDVIEWGPKDFGVHEAGQRLSSHSNLRSANAAARAEARAFDRRIREKHARQRELAKPVNMIEARMIAIAILNHHAAESTSATAARKLRAVSAELASVQPGQTN